MSDVIVMCNQDVDRREKIHHMVMIIHSIVSYDTSAFTPLVFLHSCGVIRLWFTRRRASHMPGDITYYELRERASLSITVKRYLTPYVDVKTAQIANNG
jgi:hypothetical protein